MILPEVLSIRAMMLALRELIKMPSGWNTVLGSPRCQWLAPSVLALLITR